MNIQYICKRLSEVLDNQHFGDQPATDTQIIAVRVYLQNLTGSRDDTKRYRILQDLFEMEHTPETSKILTKGQASAIITISRHEVYGPVLNDYISNL